MKKFLMILGVMLLSLSIFATTIHDVQFTTDAGDGTYPSTMVDQIVTVQGVVTATGFNGQKFFIQDGEGAWNGIYIFDWNTPVSLGDLVSVTGQVAEYYGFTEIKNVTDITIVSSGNPLPQPVVLTTNEVATSEAYEGVLVRVQNVTVAIGLDDHSQWYVTDGSGNCQIDDNIFNLQDAGINIAVGDSWGSITGVVDYAYDEFSINPRSAEDLSTTPVSSISKSWGQVKSLYK